MSRIRCEFPINSRHQEVATNTWEYQGKSEERFPINSRHQEVATTTVIPNDCDGFWEFPINSRHQEVATISKLKRIEAS